MLLKALRCLLIGLASLAPWWVHAAGEPIVIGQSIAEGRGSYRSSIALMGGVRAYVERVNASGGIAGRLIKVVTLVGDADPVSHAKNVQALVREHGAVAILGCTGDAICRSMARVAAELRVPLVGALSGSPSMGNDVSPFRFPLRPSYAAEAVALAQQIASLGLRNVALLDEVGDGDERSQALQAALKNKDIAFARFPVAWNDRPAVEVAMKGIASGHAQTVVMNVLPDTLDTLAELHVRERLGEWPPILMSFASSAFQGIGNIFEGKVLGFTQLVPNPEANRTALGREFLRDAEKYASPKAITFDGLANYMTSRVLLEAIRRVGVRVDGESIRLALSQMEGFDLGGAVVGFANGRPTGSEKVELGLRSREGYYLK